VTDVPRAPRRDDKTVGVQESLANETEALRVDPLAVDDTGRAAHQAPRRTRGGALEGWYRPALVIIVLIGLAKGIFWIAAFPFPTVDEPSHLSEIESIAHGHYPVEGKAPLNVDVLTLMKDAPLTDLNGWRATAITPSPSDPRWRLAGQNYEADQPPLYYAVMVPFFLLGHAADGILGALFAVRLASLLLGLLAVPLLGELARRLFPSQPAVWFLAPATLVGIQIFTASIAIVDNDVLVMVFGLCALLALQHARRRPSWQAGVLLGASVGLAVLTKGTSLALVPLLVLWSVSVLWVHRDRVGAVIRWLLSAVVTAAVVVTPWLGSNLATYHHLTGASAHQKLRSQINPYVPFTWAGVQHAAKTAIDSFWIPTQLYPTEPSYQLLWHVTVLVGIVGSVLLAAAVPRYRKNLWTVGSMAVALPLGLEAAAAMNVGATHTIMEARYLNVLLPVACLLVAWTAVAAAGAHVGTVALVGLLAAASVAEVRQDQTYLRSTYQTARYASLVPVVDQTYATTIVPTPSISVSNAPCPVDYVSLHLNAILPATTIDGVTPGVVPPVQIGWNTYRLPHPGSRAFVMAFTPPALVSAADPPGAAGVALEGSPAVPLIRLYCPVSDPSQFRFHQTYAYQHPFPMSWAVLDGAPRVLGAAGAALAAVTAAGTVWAESRRRRERISRRP
jgi:hypothetical protein